MCLRRFRSRIGSIPEQLSTPVIGSSAVLGNGFGSGTATDPGLGFSGTGGSYNIAVANASLYAIGFDYGLSETENGQPGPFTNFFDSNVTLINQASAMPEAGFTEGSTIDGLSVSLPISDTQPAYFPNFSTMQVGLDFNAFLKNPTPGNPAELFNEPFPLPPLTEDSTVTLPPTFSVNTDPTDTVNLYQEMANDPDIGLNPDVVGYVTGSGEFDQISITRISSTQAQVTVNAYTDDTYTTLVSTQAAEDGDPGVVSSMSYVINLTKACPTPGRKDDGLPPEIIVDGFNNNDEIFIDPTLGIGAHPVKIEIHGQGDSVGTATGVINGKTVFLNGDGTYNVAYTPVVPSNSFSASTITQTYAASLLPGGLTPGASGNMVITGNTTIFTTTTVNHKTTTKKSIVPFSTSIVFDHFNPNFDSTDSDTLDDSSIRLNNFNQLNYVAPGFLNSEYNVVDLNSGGWQISGQQDSSLNPPSPVGNLQFNNLKQFIINTSKGATTDTVSFATGDALPQGLQFVNVVMGAQSVGGTDELDFNDSLNSDGSPNFNDQNYLLSSTSLLPVQSAGSVFTGFSFSGVELLTLDGTQGTDKFTVTPSATTSYIINGDPGAVQNTLAVHLAGTQYAESDDGFGNGQWTFGNRDPITFTNMQTIVNQFGEDGVNPANFASNPIADNASPIYAGSQDSDIIALAASSDSGTSKPLVQVYSAITNQLLYQFYAYPQNFIGGVRIATADVNGDGVPDVIVAPGSGIAGEIKVYDGSLLEANANLQHFVTNPDAVALLSDIIPDPTYKTGLYVAMGDVNGDGTPDLITSHSKGATAGQRVPEQRIGRVQFVSGHHVFAVS